MNETHLSLSTLASMDLPPEAWDSWRLTWKYAMDEDNFIIYISYNFLEQL